MKLSERIKAYSWDTYQGKIRLGFLLISLMLFALVASLTIQINNSLEKNHYFDKVIDPMKTQAEQLVSSLQKSNASLNRYAIQFSIEDYKLAFYHLGRSSSIMDKEKTARSAVDSLMRLTSHINSGIIKQSELLKPKIEDIQDAYNKLADGYDLLSAFGEMEQRGLILGTIPKDLKITTELAEELLRLANDIEKTNEEDILWRVESIVGNDLQLAFFPALLLIIMVITAYWIGVYLIRNYLDRVQTLERHTLTLSKGNLIPEVDHVEDELRQTMENLRELNKELRNVRQFAFEVGQEKFDTEVDVFHHEGELGNALESMRGSLRDIHDKEELRNWQLNGINALAEVIRNTEREIQSFCDVFLNSLIEYSNLNQGAIYLYDKDNNILRMQACFAYGRKKHEKQEIEVGRGITGEAFRDGESIVLTDIPDQYIRIHTGLGDAKPTALAVIPLKYQQEKLGVMELAAFHNFSSTEIELFERVSEIFTSNLLNAINTNRTKQLLTEATEYGQRLNAQEEELRQNTEELIATRESLERKIQIIEDELGLFKALVRNNHIPVAQTDLEGKILASSTAFVRLLKDVEGDVENKSILDILPSLKQVLRSPEPISSGNFLQIHTLMLKGNKSMEVKVAVNKAKVHGRTRYAISILNNVD